MKLYELLEVKVNIKHPNLDNMYYNEVTYIYKESITRRDRISSEARVGLTDFINGYVKEIK